MNQMPKVSVCVPAYNAASHLLQTLTSIAQQTYQELEIILCDNGSTDSTFDILDQFKISHPHLNVHLYQHEKPLGMTADWNQCLSYATGEWFLLLAADDLLHPEAVSTHVAHSLSRPLAQVVFGASHVIYSNNKILLTRKMNKLNSTLSPAILPWILAQGRNIIGETGVGIFKREVFSQLDGFDMSLRYYPDFDFWLRCIDSVPCFAHDAPTFNFRLHASSATASNQKIALFEYQQLLKKYNVLNSWQTCLALTRASAYILARKCISGVICPC